MSRPAIWERYEQSEQLTIVEEVGAGGFGHVYRAHHRRLDTPVAVKVLKSQMVCNPTVATLFAREAQVMARVDHPNVLRVYDYREGPEGPYIVTEWMSGGTVAVPVDSEDELLRIGRSVASALAALHEAGVIHRDVKPDNVYGREDGRLKLGDLGVAAVGDDRESHLLVGTPPYMAPELFADPPRHSPEGDVYALGVMLYQSWTGSLPFGGSSLGELISTIREGNPRPLDQLRAGLAPHIAALIHSMMAPSPRSRPTPAEVVTAFSETSPADSNRSAGARGEIAIIWAGAWIGTQEIYLSSNWVGYLAHHCETGRLARLSTLQPESPLPESVIIDSARRASRWQHPSLTSVFDWGRVENAPYVVFDSLGHSLLDLVRAGHPFPEVEALELIEHIADGLDYLHQQGFVYQLVEPGAIYSRASGDGWALGWPCYCRPIGAEARGSRVLVPAFAAPEANVSDRFEAATDIYGLGAVLLYALCGESIRFLDLEADREAAVRARAPRVTGPTLLLLADLLSPDQRDRPGSAAIARDRARSIRTGLRGT